MALPTSGLNFRKLIFIFLNLKLMAIILTCFLDITTTELLEAIFKLEEEGSTSGNLSERRNDKPGTIQSTSQKPYHDKGQSHPATDPELECNYVIYRFIVYITDYKLNT